MRVYPRVCGGTLIVRDSIFSTPGLSPRVRGNPARRGRGNADRRSIPACAGEPRWPWPHRSDGRVYPRVCGGTLKKSSPRSRRRGLSPRVRGNHTRLSNGQDYPGSIPACAGEPKISSFPFLSPRVYPRVCGGTGMTECECGAYRGLSPRVRGNPGPGAATGKRRRSIPACAGEPKSYGGVRKEARVYPRVCGGTFS